MIKVILICLLFTFGCPTSITINQQDWQACQQKCPDPTTHNDCDQQCQAEIQFYKTQLNLQTNCQKVNSATNPKLEDLEACSWEGWIMYGEAEMPFSVFMYHDCLYGWCLDQEYKKLEGNLSINNEDLIKLPFANLIEEDLEEADVQFDTNGGYEEVDTAGQDLPSQDFYEPGAIVDFFGCAGTCPSTVCTIRQGSGAIKGATVIPDCGNTVFAYLTCLANEDTFNKMFQAQMNIEQQLQQWAESNGFSDFGIRRILKQYKKVARSAIPENLKRMLQTVEEYGELEELTNSEYEELQKYEAAFEQMLEILAYPTIKRADYVSDCQYAMIYTFVYPLAITPAELGLCFESCQTEANDALLTFGSENQCLGECATEIHQYAKAAYKSIDFDYTKDIAPVGTKLKLEQCMIDCPAPQCRSKKECENQLKPVQKCITTDADCLKAEQWFEQANDLDLIDDTAKACVTNCADKATTPAVQEWFGCLEICSTMEYSEGGLDAPITIITPTTNGRFLETTQPENKQQAAEQFALCHKKCIPKKCGKKVKLADCKKPVANYEKCMAEEQSCKDLAKWVKSDYDNVGYDKSNAEKCVNKCGLKSTNKYVKGAAVCVNNCSVKLKVANDTLSANVLKALSLLVVGLTIISLLI